MYRGILASSKAGWETTQGYRESHGLIDNKVRDAGVVQESLSFRFNKRSDHTDSESLGVSFTPKEKPRWFKKSRGFIYTKGWTTVLQKVSTFHLHYIMDQSGSESLLSLTVSKLHLSRTLVVSAQPSEAVDELVSYWSK